MNTTDERERMLKVVDEASYVGLVSLRGFEPVGSLWFVDPVVSSAVVSKIDSLAASMSIAERVAASRQVGWEKP